jgi:hypothetical protein
MANRFAASATAAVQKPNAADSRPLPKLAQVQQKCAAVLRPELRHINELEEFSDLKRRRTVLELEDHGLKIETIVRSSQNSSDVEPLTAG